MHAFETDLHQLSFTKNEVEFLNYVMKSVISKRPDQLRFAFNEYLRTAPINAINKVHDSLYKNFDLKGYDEIPNKTIWDQSINRFQSDDNWVKAVFLNVLSERDLAMMKNLKIDRDSLVASLGSCFATNISRHFRNIGFPNTYTLRVEEAVNSPKLVSMYLNPSKVDEKARVAWDSRFGIESKSILEVIPKLDLLVLTFGVGYDLVDSSGHLVLDPTDVSSKIKEKIYKFTIPSVAEQAESVSECIRAIRTLNRAIPIFVTISPVPLSGFVGDMHVLRANTLSKANLALSIKAAQSQSDFIYIPTYEVVTSIAPIAFRQNVWGEDGTSRHPNNELIKSICQAFISLFSYE
jgi:hypothetical protein